MRPDCLVRMFDRVFRRAHVCANHKEETVMDSLPAALETCAPISIRLGDFGIPLRAAQIPADVMGQLQRDMLGSVAQNSFHPTGFTEALND